MHQWQIKQILFQQLGFLFLNNTLRTVFSLIEYITEKSNFYEMNIITINILNIIAICIGICSCLNSLVRILPAHLSLIRGDFDRT